MPKVEVKQYVARQLQEQTRILRLSAYTQDDTPCAKRTFFYRIEKYLNDFLNSRTEPRWVIIPGLRGVGKTTILAQLFFQYMTQLRQRILYVSLDEVTKKLGSSLFEVLEAYEELQGVSFSALEEDMLLLVDEVHFDTNWQFALKSLYDRSRKVFIVATGSSAIALNTTTDIVRRAQMERIYPLKFVEYRLLTSGHITQSISSLLAEAFFESKDAQEVFDRLQAVKAQVAEYWQTTDIRSIDRYLKYYSLPSVLSFKDDAVIYANLNSILDRIVEKDLPALKAFKWDILATIPQLLFMLASSDISNLHGFSRDLNGIDIKTITAIFHVLEQSEVLVRVYPFSLTAPKRVRKPSKYLFLAPSLRAALLHLVDSRAIDFQHKGKLLEDVVVMYLYQHIGHQIGATLSYDETKNSADYIIDSVSSRIAVEVGWNKKHLNQVTNTLSHVKGNYGLVVTNAAYLEKRGDVLVVPFEFFFML